MKHFSKDGHSMRHTTAVREDIIAYLKANYERAEGECVTAAELYNGYLEVSQFKTSANKFGRVLNDCGLLRGHNFHGNFYCGLKRKAPLEDGLYL